MVPSVEQEVRELLSQGKTQEEIAKELGVSRSTIQRTVKKIKSSNQKPKNLKISRLNRDGLIMEK